MSTLDYNLAYYNLSQARVNQLAIDQDRYIFVDFIYQNEMVKNMYLEKDRQGFAFKIEFVSNTSGNFYTINKNFYPETLYDYITLQLDDRFLDFYLENKYNLTYQSLDLRAVWYFLNNDRQAPLFIKKVRDNKYIFSFKRMCQHYTYPIKERADIKICCKNVGLIKDIVTNLWFCPDHFGKK